MRLLDRCWSALPAGVLPSAVRPAVPGQSVQGCAPDAWPLDRELAGVRR